MIQTIVNRFKFYRPILKQEPQLKRMMPIFALILFLSFSTTYGQSDDNFWKVLSQVSYLTSTDANGYEIEKPVFSSTLRAHDGKHIVLSGYIVPLNELNGKNTFMFSSLPFNVCYFCGGAGPETVIEVEATGTLNFTTKRISLEGILKLNETDIDHHMYRLKSATIKE
jgi:hypothetical protein